MFEVLPQKDGVVDRLADQTYGSDNYRLVMLTGYVQFSFDCVSKVEQGQGTGGRICSSISLLADQKSRKDNCCIAKVKL